MLAIRNAIIERCCGNSRSVWRKSLRPSCKALRADSFAGKSGVKKNIGSTKTTNHNPLSGPEMRSPSKFAGSSPNSGTRPNRVRPVVGLAAMKPSTTIRLRMPPT